MVAGAGASRAKAFAGVSHSSDSESSFRKSRLKLWISDDNFILDDLLPNIVSIRREDDLLLVKCF